MTVEEAVEIRDRAMALGLAHCCDKCRDAIERLEKLGARTGSWTLVPSPDPNAAHRAPTLGLGNEEAARYLRRQIGAAA